MPELYFYQKEALKRMHNGCILNGGVGSGKSITSLAYFYSLNGGDPENPRTGLHLKDLYIITTARKRDDLEWDSELAKFYMSIDQELNGYDNNIVVDSWNNIKKYVDVSNAFFIFDEQRVVGYGSWTKSFLKITKNNQWILLSATPGDSWMDYAPVFIANGYYKNITDFRRQHCVYSRYSKYPKIDRYINTGRLNKLRRDILIPMNFNRKTKPHHITIFCDYNKEEYRFINKERWNIRKDKPIKNATEFCLELRRNSYSDPSRLIAVLDILEKHHKAIIFYNFDYELELLENTLKESNITYSQYNGHKHEPIPETDSWAYLVQYNSGCEGWNCTKTDTMIFYSQNYSYKMMQQASGRIDRLNTPYKDLYYYHLKSRSGIEMAISKALKNKKNFNESDYYNANDVEKKGA